MSALEGRDINKYRYNNLWETVIIIPDITMKLQIATKFIFRCLVYVYGV